MKKGTAIISVNDIEVGAMPLEQYEDIVRSVNKSWLMRIHGFNQYFWYLLKQFCGLVDLFIRVFATVAVAAAIFFYYSSRDNIALNGELPLRLKDIYQITQLILNASIVLTIITSGLKFLFSGADATRHFISPRRHAIAYKIRQVMEVPAEGKVSVMIIKNAED
ncbi:hypothetical protein IOW44_004408 [Salmonella enterica]|jgi:hypothetical protein|nr:hypothetical protein [Salmonella enterica]